LASAVAGPASGLANPANIAIWQILPHVQFTLAIYPTSMAKYTEAIYLVNI